MKRKINEWFSIIIAKNPGRVVLAGIFVFNIVFFILSAGLISSLSLSGTESMNFLEAAFCTITMILDAGCIQFVVADIGQAGVAITVVCLVIIFVGMISFTGAVIGYITNYISDFIGNANAGNNSLKLTDHIVILNWNTRASEIINDLMYCSEREKVVILVRSHRAEIEREINERLSDTVNRENEELKAEHKKFAKNYSKRITVVVREGDVFSSKQLHDISLERAKTIIILGDEYQGKTDTGNDDTADDETTRGNSQTIKTLMQVADITSASSSADHQRVVVEITDPWTEELVNRIIEYKQVEGKCNIVPVCVNKVLGLLLSQFSIMPELNIIYRELLSNKGVSFYYCNAENGKTDLKDYIRAKTHAIPLCLSQFKGEEYLFFAGEGQNDIHHEKTSHDSSFTVEYNPDYAIERKHVIIMGHNSKTPEIMAGFESFRTEWRYTEEGEEVLDIIVIDDRKSLEKMNYYKDYEFVAETVEATIYDRELIFETINGFIAKHSGDTSVLILSDDSVRSDETDSQALANLVYVQNIITQKMAEDPEFEADKVDLIVEIIDPKHHDIISNYSVNNVVISNRFISKMITQIGEKDALFDFYSDILTFDTDIEDGYDSMEVYVKRADKLFYSIPGKCSAHELIQAMYLASTDPGLPKNKQNPSVILGYIRRGTGMTLFNGDLENITVELKANDLLIVYSSH